MLPHRRERNDGVRLKPEPVDWIRPGNYTYYAYSSLVYTGRVRPGYASTVNYDRRKIIFISEIYFHKR